MSLQPLYYDRSSNKIVVVDFSASSQYNNPNVNQIPDIALDPSINGTKPLYAYELEGKLSAMEAKFETILSEIKRIDSIEQLKALIEKIE